MSPGREIPALLARTIAPGRLFYLQICGQRQDLSHRRGGCTAAAGSRISCSVSMSCSTTEFLQFINTSNVFGKGGSAGSPYSSGRSGDKDIFFLHCFPATFQNGDLSNSISEKN